MAPEEFVRGSMDAGFELAYEERRMIVRIIRRSSFVIIDMEN